MDLTLYFINVIHLFCSHYNYTIINNVLNAHSLNVLTIMIASYYHRLIS